VNQDIQVRRDLLETRHEPTRFIESVEQVFDADSPEQFESFPGVSSEYLRLMPHRDQPTLLAWLTRRLRQINQAERTAYPSWQKFDLGMLQVREATRILGIPITIQPGLAE
jgi:hypothetical protein